MTAVEFRRRLNAAKSAQKNSKMRTLTLESPLPGNDDVSMLPTTLSLPRSFRVDDLTSLHDGVHPHNSLKRKKFRERETLPSCGDNVSGILKNCSNYRSESGFYGGSLEGAWNALDCFCLFLCFCVCFLILSFIARILIYYFFVLSRIMFMLNFFIVSFKLTLRPFLFFC